VGLHPPGPLRRGLSTTLPGAAVRHHPLLAGPPRWAALRVKRTWSHLAPWAPIVWGCLLSETAPIR
jgi:hypothetical protein